MDRRNGDPTAPPPRPPKTFSNQPRVHRPRAPEPDQAAVVPPRPLNRMNSSASSTASNHRPQPAIPAQLPTTAPLTPLQNRNINISNRVNYNSSNSNNLMSAPVASTFSRRRQETRPSPSPAPARSITPVTTNLISARLGNRTPSPTANNVSLQLPRPENERLPNEYVDTPFTNNKTTVTLSRHQPPSSVTPNLNQNHSHLNTNISTIDGIRVLNSSQSPQLSVHSSSSEKNILPNRTAVRPNTLPITKQPSFNSSTLTKKDHLRHCHEDVLDAFTLNGSATNNSGLIINNDQIPSIACPQCSRCRCAECQRPRQLPSRWLCGDNCLCSAETIIDYASCLCCVKALCYHCSKDHELDLEADSIRFADDPCSCVPYKRTSRWGCLSALCIILPCLWCYWPMRGCVSLCAKCYEKHSRHGCRCNNNQTSTNNNRLNTINNLSNGAHTAPISHQRRNNNDLTPEKRLLDASNSEY